MPGDDRLSNVSSAAHESPRVGGTVVDLGHAARYRDQFLGPGDLKGECAAGVQFVFAVAGRPLGLTRTWKPGKLVKGNGITPGTAIASFRAGRYANDHAAIFIREDSDGLWVWDQYNSPPKKWGIRLLSFRAPVHDYSNNGNLFYVIEH